MNVDGKKILKVAPEGLTLLAETCMKEVSHYLRASHLEKLAQILEDPEASDNDKYVAMNFLRNAQIAAELELPSCQDTGTAIIMGKKGQYVWTDEHDGESLSRGVYNAYTKLNLRYSQNAPLSMYEEVNTKTNLPAQIDLYAIPGNEYKFMFMAKGGGSANKSYLFQETKALLTPERLMPFIEAKIKSLGTAACPPYHLAVVIGGTSAETCLKTVKLASAKYLDNLHTSGNELGRAFRDLEMERTILEMTRKMGIGAQFGGKYFCHDVRVIRMPRHGASCPVGIGVSCSADRQCWAKITEEGLFVEQLEHNPSRFLEKYKQSQTDSAVKIDLNRPMSEILKTMSQYPVKTRFSLSGPIIVGRDIAHAKIMERLNRGEEMPQYMKDHIIYYAGPAKTPKGMASGSFGPTTAGRMDPYVGPFMAKGGSMISLAKGNRSQQVTDACKKYGGFYLGSIGGPAAVLAKENIKKVECLEYPELGMEAIWKIDVVDFPAFLLVDDKGNNFFDGLL
ncbi:uncharacterized protein [Blastocystis hominis]|nr:uncharacterized protein [Blastocystis hominis]CBK25175.2 unnamed protein product [Blastocystis hominis]|eukprot:XP_012899223.1 uncharacterized protein [Blastocystis hominis]